MTTARLIDDTDDETVTFTDVPPVVDVTKTASPTSVPETGGPVTFTFVVDNAGDEDFTLTSLSDTVFGDLNGQGTCATGGLVLVGDSYTCELTVTLSADDLVAHQNSVTASVIDDDGTTVDDTDDETVTFTNVDSDDHRDEDGESDVGAGDRWRGDVHVCGGQRWR